MSKRMTTVLFVAAAAWAGLALPGIAAASDPPAAQSATLNPVPAVAAPAPAAEGDRTASGIAPAASQAPAAGEDDPDLSPTPMQPDFYLVSLPTTLRLPAHKLAFRVTHRFTRPLNQGSFGDSLSDFFGLDAGARFERILQEEEVPLEPRDLFLFFTDGVSEAMNTGAELFGEGRLRRILEEGVGLGSEELKERILEEIRRFVGDADPHDAMTLVVLKVVPEERAA